MQEIDIGGAGVIARKQTADRLVGRVVIVSPHLDDAIMSLGATIALAEQGGAQIEVLTAFGDTPTSPAPASTWDRDCGFSTEGEAAVARRDEDRRACAMVGAKPRWLSFGCESYERRGSDNEIWSAIASATRGADAVLIPGFPLAHADHAFLSCLLLRKGLNVRFLGLYLEQPYAFTLKETPRGSGVASPLKHIVKRPLAWTRVPVAREYRRAKLRAVRAYDSQLRHLGLGNIGLHRMLWRETAQGGEAIAWLS